MDADLEQQILVAALGVDARHRLAHAQRRRERAVGRRKRRHHRVADGLDHRARLRRHDVVEHVKMLAHQIVGDEIADPLVKRGRAFEVGEQKSQADDLEPLVDVERVGAIDVAEGLVGENALGGEERPALADQLVEARRSRSTPPAARAAGAVRHGQPHRARPASASSRSARRRPRKRVPAPARPWRAPARLSGNARNAIPGRIR